MFYDIYLEENDKQFIRIELSKTDLEYLIKNKSISEFDNNNKIRIELTGEK